MKLLLGLIGIGLLLIPPAAATATNFNKLHASVKSLAVVADGKLRNICTVSGINKSKHYWLTAAHCIEAVEYTYYIDGDKAFPVMRDVPNDLAILRTNNITVPTLKLAEQGPRVGDFVAVMGFPFGWTSQLYSPGVVMNTSMQIAPDEPGWDNYWMIINAQGAPGNSGSPVFDKNDDIVGVVQIGWGRSWSVLGSVTYEVLAKYAVYWN